MRKLFVILILSLTAVVPVLASGFVADVSVGDSFSFDKLKDGTNSSFVSNEVKFGLDAGYAFSRSFALLADFEYAFSVASFKNAIGASIAPYSYYSAGLLGRYRNSSFLIDFGGGAGIDSGADKLGKGLFWFVKVVPAFSLFPFVGDLLALDFTIPFEYRRLQYYDTFSVGVGVRLGFRGGMRKPTSI